MISEAYYCDCCGALLVSDDGDYLCWWAWDDSSRHVCDDCDDLLLDVLEKSDVIECGNVDGYNRRYDRLEMDIGEDIWDKLLKRRVEIYGNKIGML